MTGAAPSANPSKPGPPSSRPPPPKRKNDLVYAVLGLVFFGAAVGLWMSLGTDEPPQPAPPPVQEIARANPIAEPDLELEPEPEPAPVPVPEPVPDPAKKPATAPAREGGWDCSGEIPVAAIKGVIDTNRSQVRACYERRLKVNSILQGSLRLKIKIGADGAVADTQTGGTLRDAEVSSCVRTLASTWRFPAPTGGRCAVVEAPFQFEPKAD
jgi:outer membrane biosynthesis protein TonB